MSLTRRQFLRLGGATAAAVAASGCSAIGREVAQRDLPEALTAVSTPPQTVDPVLRFLNRAGYGPAPGQLARARRLGLAAILEEQLHPDAVDDTASDLLARRLTLYQMDPTQLVEQEPKDAVVELVGTAVARARYSKRQLYEAMVEFWSDHFNIYARKNEITPLLKIADDRDVIRPYALSTFRELLAAAVKSPAMLVYLDNVENEASHPNENYARELLELHTLGVHGGYTQQDVQELARALTGWTVGRRGRYAGKWIFDPDRHDDGEKRLLGRTLPAGQGEGDVAQVVEILAAHPSTAVFIATKLARRFVADDPPPALVTRLATSFQSSDGDIKAMLRTLFLSDEFAAAPPKLKRPFTFFISALRALHTDLNPRRARAIGDWLTQLGQLPFHWPPPDGYPDTSAAWLGNLLPRWNFALTLAHNAIPGMTPPLAEIVAAGGAETAVDALNLFAQQLYGRSLTSAEQAQFGPYLGSGPLADVETQTRLRDCVALLLAGPEFQWT